MTTREEAIKAAGRVCAVMYQVMDQMTPREQAEAAWRAGSEYTIDELENKIRRRRGLPLRHAS